MPDTYLQERSDLIPLAAAASEVAFVDPESAKDLVRDEPVVFAEIVGQGSNERSLEVHVLRRAGHCIYEVERDDTGPIPAETVHAIVARIAAAHHCRYATICPAEDRWPPAWALLPASSVNNPKQSAP